MSKSVSLSMFTPLWQGKNFIENFTDDLNSWNHTTRRIGGYWQASYPKTVSRQEIDYWFENGLGCHVTCKNDALETVWEGCVNSMTFNIGRFSIKVGPLMDLVNRSYAYYRSIDVATGLAENLQQITDEYNRRDAQARYGIITQMLSLASAAEDAARDNVRRYVDESAWSCPTHSISPVGSELSMSFELYGYVRFLEKGIYRQVSEAGRVTIDQKIASVLLSEPNSLFNVAGVRYTADQLANGSFEIAGAGAPDVWASWTENAGTGALADSTTEVHSGAHAAQLTSGASADTYIYQDFTVVPGRAYRLELYTLDSTQITKTGTHNGIANSPYLRDTTRVGKTAWSGIGKYSMIANTTDGSLMRVTAINPGTGRIEGTLYGGAENDWDVADAYTVYTDYNSSRFRLYDVTNAADIMPLQTTTQFGDEEWHQCIFNFYAPVGCTSVRLYLYCPVLNTAICYFDSVSIREWSVGLEEQSTMVDAYEDRRRAPFAVIREAVDLGDADFKPYNWGIYADRRPVLEVVPDEIAYTVSAYDPASEYRTIDGQRIEQYDLQPGRWLLITDVLVGHMEIDPRRNPRAMLIEEIQYNASTGASLNPGKYSTLKQHMARLGIQEM